jgi:autotransporter family porin
MIPPGGTLPSDEQCAGLVKDTSESDPETVPGNIPFNHVRGAQRLPPDFFAPGSGDPREDKEIAARVTGNFTGTTAQIVRWAACKWGIDERYVRAQAKVESSWRQTKRGDWTSDATRCAPGHQLGADGRPGQCPESFGVLQVRYEYFPGAFPAAIESTAFNIDTAYAVWRACYEGYEWWLRDVQAPGHPYAAGSVWGCIGRWYSGEWFDQAAQGYAGCVQQVVAGRSSCT